MNIYNLLSGEINAKNAPGRIWCTDGSILSPDEFKESGRDPSTAYGYIGLKGNTAVRLFKGGYYEKHWMDPSANPAHISRSGVLACSNDDGLSNTDLLITDVLSQNSLKLFPALSYALGTCNAGVYAYMPAIDELINLYWSLNNGKMRKDLIDAGLYESCNYAKKYGGSVWNWGSVWSSTEYSETEAYTFEVLYNGQPKVLIQPKSLKSYVIPFFLL